MPHTDIECPPQCECADGICPHNPTRSTPPYMCLADATWIAYRVDMEDITGTAMCGECADDAAESGLFRMAKL